VQVGRVLDERYELVRLIAEGATSGVWAARDKETGEEVAIKAISLEHAGWRAEVRDRFLQEARLLSMSPHGNLVGLRDFRETDDGYLFLVLDLLEGETLAERMGHPPRLSYEEAASIALGISRGVAALHAQGIVHRDLKPGNIILVPQGETTVAKIIDLGISKVRAAAADPKLYATLTATGQVLGTPQYMSYEQALGERDVDARSDVWSIGVVLYEMLAGKPPFAVTNLNAALAAIRREKPAPVREISPGTPPALAGIVGRCMEKERERRFQDAAALAHELEVFLLAAGDGDGIRARSRVPILVGLGALATVAILGLLAAGARGPGGQAPPEGSASLPASLPSNELATTGPSAAPSPTEAVSSAPAPTEEAVSPAPAAASPRVAPRKATPKTGGRGRATRIDSAGF
jgi:serine/threonine-protein kinase